MVIFTELKRYHSTTTRHKNINLWNWSISKLKIENVRSDGMAARQQWYHIFSVYSTVMLCGLHYFTGCRSRLTFTTAPPAVRLARSQPGPRSASQCYTSVCSVTPIPAVLQRRLNCYTGAWSVTPIPAVLERRLNCYTSVWSVKPVPAVLHRFRQCYNGVWIVTPVSGVLHRFRQCYSGAWIDV